MLQYYGMGYKLVPARNVKAVAVESVS